MSADKTYDMQNPKDMKEYFADLQNRIVMSTKEQLIAQGQKYYCSNCSTAEMIISSDEKEICSECGKMLISLDDIT